MTCLIWIKFSEENEKTKYKVLRFLKFGGILICGK